MKTDTGRFLSPDSKGLVDGPNLYQFLLNNPFLYLDNPGWYIN
ncbi:RHS repeat-associated core domain-containing protein [Simkania negevensis]